MADVSGNVQHPPWAGPPTRGAPGTVDTGGGGAAKGARVSNGTARRVVFVASFLMVPLPMHVLAPVLAPPAHYVVLAAVTVAVAATEGAQGPVPAIRAVLLAYAGAYTLLAWLGARLVWTAVAAALLVTLLWPVYRTLSRAPRARTWSARCREARARGIRRAAGGRARRGSVPTDRAAHPVRPVPDDEGWRVESAAFPALHERGSRFDATRAPGGYYTARDLRALVAYAASRGVDVVPEIDVPGHTLAMLHAMPELACRLQPGVARRAEEFPIVPWHTPPVREGDETLCVCDDRALVVLQALVDELIAVFPGPCVHLGGDEAFRTEWALDARCPALAARAGLAGLGQLQAWFTAQLERMLVARGRRLIIWDDVHAVPAAPHATPSSRTAYMRWHYDYAPATLFDHDVVQADAAALYLDAYQVPLAETYAYEPVPAGLDAVRAARVLGPHGAMWTHVARTRQAVDQLVFPRLLAIAETGWTPADRKARPDFAARVEAHRARLDLLGVRR